MERVSVLHQEFPGAHDAKTGAALIAELGLNLIEIGGQLFVALQLVTNQIGDHFLMGRPEAEVAAVAIIHPQEFATILFPAARFLP